MLNTDKHNLKVTLRQYFSGRSWWGKLIGALLGYLISGPAGAVFGLLIGNFFDRGLMQHFSRPYWEYHAEKKIIQKLFFESTFSVMGHIAKADGRVSEQEIKMASALMQDMRLNARQKKAAQRFFSAGKRPDFNLHKTLSLLRETLHDNPELLKLYIDIQYRAARVDGLGEKKLQAMNTVLQYLGFAPLHQQYRFYEDFVYQSANQKTNYQSHQRKSSSKSSEGYTYQPKDGLAHAFAILGVSNHAAKEDVKKAYRKLISKNHPDKLIAQGLPEEMIKMANDKTQKIRKAYEQICASKGWQ